MKFCIIGLGRFGKQLARSLMNYGGEVLAIDSNEHEIAAIQNEVTQAMCTEIVDTFSLESIGIESIDIAIVAIGEDIAQSILIAALIKKNYPHIKVITRAMTQTQKDILELLRVDEIVLPEEKTAIELADKLSFPFVNLARLSESYSISLFQVPSSFVGKTITELQFYDEYKVHCIAVKRNMEFLSIDQDYELLEYDEIVLAGKNEALEAINSIQE